MVVSGLYGGGWLPTRGVFSVSLILALSRYKSKTACLAPCSKYHVPILSHVFIGL